jgi:tetraacyldisaccharide 4'-kinase
MTNKTSHLQRILLAPFALIYGIIIWFRNRMFDYGFFHISEFQIPIISVGNITAGGTGKTPHVEYLISLLKDEYKLAILSRGYKRKTSGFVMANATSQPDEIGDEPCQMKEKFPKVAVAVDAKRSRGMQKLTELCPDLEIVVLDDAYQHRWVKPGISVLLTDFNRPMKDDMLIPSGLLREPASESKRADFIIVTKCPQEIKPIDQRLMEKDMRQYAYQHLFFTTYKYGQPTPLFESNTVKNISKLIESKPYILLLTGIAENSELRKHVEGFAGKIIEMSYPDHYEYSAHDLHDIIDTYSGIMVKEKCILTTEKDAIKLKQFGTLDEEIKSALFYIPIEVEFLNNDAKNFNQHIQTYVRNNKSDSILHKKSYK